MPVLDALERGVLFNLARLVTLVIILAFCVPLAVSGIVYYHFFGAGSHINYADISDELHPQSSIPYPKTAPKTETLQAQSGVTLPDSLKKYFTTPESQQDLEHHLDNLDTEGQRDYLNNLDEVVSSAQNSNADVPQVIQQYFQDKDRHIGRTSTDMAYLWGSRVALAIFTVLTLILVAISSLILVLLAIERNTRQPKAPRIRAVATPVSTP